MCDNSRENDKSFRGKFENLNFGIIKRNACLVYTNLGFPLMISSQMISLFHNSLANEIFYMLNSHYSLDKFQTHTHLISQNRYCTLFIFFLLKLKKGKEEKGN